MAELILELYGPERGAHTRSAAGMAVLPLDIPVEIEAEVEIAVWEEVHRWLSILNSSNPASSA
jgi:hypothetical protein